MKTIHHVLRAAYVGVAVFMFLTVVELGSALFHGWRIGVLLGDMRLDEFLIGLMRSGWLMKDAALSFVAAFIYSMAPRR